MAPAKPAKAAKRYFTVEEANRTLPLVRRIMSDVLKSWDVVNELEQRMLVLTRGRAAKQRSGDLYDEEVTQSETALVAERTELQVYVEELRQLGVELKGFDGICDFPSQLGGREVCLCWRVGESSVAHWHEVNTGFAGRKPIHPQPAAAAKVGESHE